MNGHRALAGILAARLVAHAAPATQEGTNSGASPPRRTVRFAYVLGPDTDDCPSETALRGAVMERLGYDPFRADARETVVVTLERAKPGFGAKVEVRDETGRVTGSRSLSSTRNDCAALASAMALAVAIAIDPLLVVRQAPAPTPECPACPQCSTGPECPKCPPPPAPPETRFRATLGGHVAHGATPGTVGVGARIAAGVRRANLSLALEGRADPPLGDPTAQGDVSATLLSLALVPCAHRGRLVACAVAAGGVLQGESVRLSLPRRDTTFHAAAGGRLGLELPLTDSLFLGFGAEVLATLTRTTLWVNDRPAWTTPALSASLVTALGVTFW